MIGLARAFLWLEYHLAKQYRWAMLSQLVQFFVFLVIFSRLPMNELTDEFGGLPYLHFILTGLVYQSFYEAIMNGPTSRLNELQQTGQLQLVLSAPHPRWMILLAAGSASCLGGFVRALVILISGALVFGVPLHLESMSALAASLAYTFTLSLGLALLNVAGTLLWPRVNLTSLFSSLLLGLFSGVFVPIDRLPELIQPLARVNPLRWGLDVFRSSLGQHVPVGGYDWIPALGAVVLICGAAVMAYRKADRVLTSENRYQYF